MYHHAQRTSAQGPLVAELVGAKVMAHAARPTGLPSFSPASRHSVRYLSVALSRRTVLAARVILDNQALARVVAVIEPATPLLFGVSFTFV